MKEIVKQYLGQISDESYSSSWSMDVWNLSGDSTRGLWLTEYDGIISLIREREIDEERETEVLIEFTTEKDLNDWLMYRRWTDVESYEEREMRMDGLKSIARLLVEGIDDAKLNDDLTQLFYDTLQREDFEVSDEIQEWMLGATEKEIFEKYIQIL